jgi:integral membrane protein (TIGR01906 family)
MVAFTASIAFLINSAWLWTAEWEKHDVPRALADAGLPLTDDQFQDIAHGLIRYFNSGGDYIDLSVTVNGRPVALFTQEETLHFKDVKDLFRLDYWVLVWAFLYCLVFALVTGFRWGGRHRRVLARSAVWGGSITLGIMLLLGIGVLVDFQGFWLLFHFLSFSNEFWSAEGNMLLLFPGGFWYDMVVYVALSAVALALILGGLGTVCRFKMRREKNDSRA